MTTTLRKRPQPLPSKARLAEMIIDQNTFYDTLAEFPVRDQNGKPIYIVSPETEDDNATERAQAGTPEDPQGQQDEAQSGA